MSAVLIALAAAAEFSLPHADIRLAEYIQRHTPSSVDREGIWAATEVEVFVDPTGKILECSPKRVAGDVELARTLCSISIGQVMTSPHDFSGRPVHAVNRVILTAYPNNSTSPVGRLGHVANERLEISVLPDGRIPLSIPLVALQLLIDEKGSVASCAAVTEVSTDIKNVACREAAAQRFPTRNGEEKQPVPYIRLLMAEFTQAKSDE